MYDFSGEAGTAELSIKVGDILTVTRKDVGEGWWEGRSASGQTGLFPAAYVQVSNSVVGFQSNLRIITYLLTLHTFSRKSMQVSHRPCLLLPYLMPTIMMTGVTTRQTLPMLIHRYYLFCVFASKEVAITFIDHWFCCGLVEL